MRYLLHRPPEQRCPGCDRPHAHRHAPRCRLLDIPASRRHPAPYVTATDLAVLACGCSALLVAHHGSWGHRVDHSEPDYRRPALFGVDERVALASLIVVALVMAAFATTQPDTARRVVAGAVAAATLGAAVILIAKRRLHAPTEWPGRKAFEANEPGRYIHCPACLGDGIMFAEAYPALPGPDPTTAPTSR